ncbi:hypothetical protein EON65_49330 [archaeon]|nr:MAG: hypothetical protein EON65_49330 [archaeon]
MYLYDVFGIYTERGQKTASATTRIASHWDLASPATVASPSLVRRCYILYNLQRPVGLLTYGVRDFLVQCFKGRPVSGQVFRANKEYYGQCIILRISGDRESLKVAEDEVLSLKDENGVAYWDFEVEREDSIHALGSHSFTMTQSGRGAPSGPNSDPKNDHFSERQMSKKSSRSDHSSKLSK